MERRRPLRLDKFLFFARLAKSRAKAQTLIAEGSPRLDGRPVTQDGSVTPGQMLTFVHYGNVRVIEIVALPGRRGPAAEAAACYLDKLAPQPIDGAAG